MTGPRMLSWLTASWGAESDDESADEEAEARIADSLKRDSTPPSSDSESASVVALARNSFDTLESLESDASTISVPWFHDATPETPLKVEKENVPESVPWWQAASADMPFPTPGVKDVPRGPDWYAEATPLSPVRVSSPTPSSQGYFDNVVPPRIGNDSDSDPSFFTAVASISKPFRLKRKMRIGNGTSAPGPQITTAVSASGRWNHHAYAASEYGYSVHRNDGDSDTDTVITTKSEPANMHKITHRHHFGLFGLGLGSRIHSIVPPPLPPRPSALPPTPSSIDTSRSASKSRPRLTKQESLEFYAHKPPSPPSSISRASNLIKSAVDQIDDTSVMLSRLLRSAKRVAEPSPDAKVVGHLAVTSIDEEGFLERIDRNLGRVEVLIRAVLPETVAHQVGLVPPAERIVDRKQSHPELKVMDVLPADPGVVAHMEGTLEQFAEALEVPHKKVVEEVHPKLVATAVDGDALPMYTADTHLPESAIPNALHHPTVDGARRSVSLPANREVISDSPILPMTALPVLPTTTASYAQLPMDIAGVSMTFDPTRNHFILNEVHPIAQGVESSMQTVAERLSLQVSPPQPGRLSIHLPHLLASGRTVPHTLPSEAFPQDHATLTTFTQVHPVAQARIRDADLPPTQDVAVLSPKDLQTVAEVLPTAAIRALSLPMDSEKIVEDNVHAAEWDIQRVSPAILAREPNSDSLSHEDAAAASDEVTNSAKPRSISITDPIPPVQSHLSVHMPYTFGVSKAVPVPAPQLEAEVAQLTSDVALKNILPYALTKSSSTAPLSELTSGEEDNGTGAKPINTAAILPTATSRSVQMDSYPELQATSISWMRATQSEDGATSIINRDLHFTPSATTTERALDVANHHGRDHVDKLSPILYLHDARILPMISAQNSIAEIVRESESAPDMTALHSAELELQSILPFINGQVVPLSVEYEERTSVVTNESLVGQCAVSDELSRDVYKPSTGLSFAPATVRSHLPQLSGSVRSMAIIAPKDTVMEVGLSKVNVSHILPAVQYAERVMDVEMEQVAHDITSFGPDKRMQISREPSERVPAITQSVPVANLLPIITPRQQKADINLMQVAVVGTIAKPVSARVVLPATVGSHSSLELVLPSVARSAFELQDGFSTIPTPVHVARISPWMLATANSSFDGYAQAMRNSEVIPNPVQLSFKPKMVMPVVKPAMVDQVFGEKTVEFGVIAAAVGIDVITVPLIETTVASIPSEVATIPKGRFPILASLENHGEISTSVHSNDSANTPTMSHQRSLGALADLSQADEGLDGEPVSEPVLSESLPEATLLSKANKVDETQSITPVVNLSQRAASGDDHMESRGPMLQKLEGPQNVSENSAKQSKSHSTDSDAVQNALGAAAVLGALTAAETQDQPSIAHEMPSQPFARAVSAIPVAGGLASNADAVKPVLGLAVEEPSQIREASWNTPFPVVALKSQAQDAESTTSTASKALSSSQHTAEVVESHETAPSMMTSVAGSTEKDDSSTSSIFASIAAAAAAVVAPTLSSTDNKSPVTEIKHKEDGTETTDVAESERAALSPTSAPTQQLLVSGTEGDEVINPRGLINDVPVVAMGEKDSIVAAPLEVFGTSEEKMSAPAALHMHSSPSLSPSADAASDTREREIDEATKSTHSLPMPASVGIGELKSTAGSDTSEDKVFAAEALRIPSSPALSSWNASVDAPVKLGERGVDETETSTDQTSLPTLPALPVAVVAVAAEANAVPTRQPSSAREVPPHHCEQPAAVVPTESEEGSSASLYVHSEVVAQPEDNVAGAVGPAAELVEGTRAPSPPHSDVMLQKDMASLSKLQVAPAAVAALGIATEVPRTQSALPSPKISQEEDVSASRVQTVETAIVHAQNSDERPRAQAVSPSSIISQQEDIVVGSRAPASLAAIVATVEPEEERRAPLPVSLKYPLLEKGFAVATNANDQSKVDATHVAAHTTFLPPVISSETMAPAPEEVSQNPDVGDFEDAIDSYYLESRESMVVTPETPISSSEDGSSVSSAEVQQSSDATYGEDSVEHSEKIHGASGAAVAAERNLHNDNSDAHPYISEDDVGSSTPWPAPLESLVETHVATTSLKSTPHPMRETAVTPKKKPKAPMFEAASIPLAGCEIADAPEQKVEGPIVWESPITMRANEVLVARNVDEPISNIPAMVPCEDIIHEEVDSEERGGHLMKDVILLALSMKPLTLVRDPKSRDTLPKRDATAVLPSRSRKSGERPSRKVSQRGKIPAFESVEGAAPRSMQKAKGTVVERTFPAPDGDFEPVAERLASMKLMRSQTLTSGAKPHPMVRTISDPPPPTFQLYERDARPTRRMMETSLPALVPRGARTSISSDDSNIAVVDGGSVNVSQDASAADTNGGFRPQHAVAEPRESSAETAGYFQPRQIPPVPDRHLDIVIPRTPIHSPTSTAALPPRRKRFHSMSSANASAIDSGISDVSNSIITLPIVADAKVPRATTSTTPSLSRSGTAPPRSRQSELPQAKTLMDHMREVIVARAEVDTVNRAAQSRVSFDRLSKIGLPRRSFTGYLTGKNQSAVDVMQSTPELGEKRSVEIPMFNALKRNISESRASFSSVRRSFSMRGKQEASAEEHDNLSVNPMVQRDLHQPSVPAAQPYVYNGLYDIENASPVQSDVQQRASPEVDRALSTDGGPYDEEQGLVDGPRWERTWLPNLIAVISTFAFVLLVSLVHAAAPAIARGPVFGPNVSTYATELPMAALMVTSIGATPLWIWWSTHWGSLWPLTFCVMFFTLFTALCAGVTDWNAIIALQACVGLASGGIVPLSFLLIRETTKLRHAIRNYVLLIFAVIIALALGPIIGYALVLRGYTRWRWVFLIPPMVALIACLMCVVLLARGRRQKRSLTSTAALPTPRSGTGHPGGVGLLPAAALGFCLAMLACAIVWGGQYPGSKGATAPASATAAAAATGPDMGLRFTPEVRILHGPGWTQDKDGVWQFDREAAKGGGEGSGGDGSAGSGSGGSSSGGSGSGGRTPGGATPGGTAPDGTNPGGTAPGGTAPGGTAPGGTAPGGTAPGGTAPTTPDGTTPGGTTPGGTTPGGTNADGTTPGGILPGGTNPDGTTPGGTFAPGATPPVIVPFPPSATLGTPTTNPTAGPATSTIPTLTASPPFPSSVGPGAEAPRDPDVERLQRLDQCRMPPSFYDYPNIGKASPTSKTNATLSSLLSVPTWAGVFAAFAFIAVATLAFLVHHAFTGRLFRDLHSRSLVTVVLAESFGVAAFAAFARYPPLVIATLACAPSAAILYPLVGAILALLALVLTPHGEGTHTRPAVPGAFVALIGAVLVALDVGDVASGIGFAALCFGTIIVVIGTVATSVRSRASTAFAVVWVGVGLLAGLGIGALLATTVFRTRASMQHLPNTPSPNDAATSNEIGDALHLVHRAVGTPLTAAALLLWGVAAYLT
ncbi:hypothetical protein DFJ77DRAFT_550316 [Powellomyces hirtus]|nr:hypothetical protein DFJ77DRAFT_550316 [Powellomyces hirtus]